MTHQQTWIRRHSPLDMSPENIIHLTDIPGRLEHYASAQYCLKNIDGAIIVFDVTNQVTFDNLPFWLNEMRQVNPKIKLLLLANKIDLVSERVVSADVAIEFAEEQQLYYREISAMCSKQEEALQLIRDFAGYQNY